MKVNFTKTVVALLAVLFIGQNINAEMSSGGKGALIGGGSGALVGGLASGSGYGALGGAAGGALVGGLVGHSVDKKREREDAQYYREERERKRRRTQDYNY